MVRSILVPLDGSPFGEHALPMAIGLARKAGAALHLAHVHNMLEATYAELQLFDDSLDRGLRKTEQAYLEHVQQRVHEVAPVDVTVNNIDGETAVALRDEAVRVGANVVGMTTHARGPVGRFWLGGGGVGATVVVMTPPAGGRVGGFGLGSGADERERGLPMPLLLLHPPKGPPRLADAPAVEHILVPLDGTPRAERILDPVTDFA